MIKIEYNIELNNPVKNSLKETDTLEKISTLSVEKTSSGYVIQGHYKKGYEILKASENSFVGDDYFITNNFSSKYTLEEKYPDFLDVEEVISLNGLDYNSLPSKYKSNIFIPSNIKEDVYLLKHIVDKQGDCIFYTINNGVLQLEEISLEPPTNIVTFSSSNLLIYFLVNQPLKVSTDDYLFLDKDKLLDIEEGFNTLESNFIFNSQINLTKLEDSMYKLQTSKEDEFISSIPIYVDNIKTNKYSNVSNELLLLDCNVQNILLSEIDNLIVEDNITTIYKVLEDNSLEPYLLFYSVGLLEVDESLLISTENESNLEILESDIEFQKQYLVQQYKIELLLTDNSTYYLYNDHLLKTIKDKITDFEGKIVKNDN